MGNSIGNDLVDLNSLDTKTHERFDSRVFTDFELQSISDQAHVRWLTWAAKEAGYKALKRIIPGLTFIPKNFEFDIKNKIIRMQDKHMFCNWELNREYVYLYCSTSSLSQYNWVSLATDADLSKSVRVLALEKIAAVLNEPKNNLAIAMSTIGFPDLSINNQVTKHLLSFTHHGKFVGVQFLCLM